MEIRFWAFSGKSPVSPIASLNCLIRGERFGERWVDIGSPDSDSLPEDN